MASALLSHLIYVKIFVDAVGKSVIEPVGEPAEPAEMAEPAEHTPINPYQNLRLSNHSY